MRIFFSFFSIIAIKCFSLKYIYILYKRGVNNNKLCIQIMKIFAAAEAATTNLLLPFIMRESYSTIAWRKNISRFIINLTIIQLFRYCFALLEFTRILSG
jgi:hypothetical protein